MRIIVSNTLTREYSKFTVVRSFDKVHEYSNVDTLVIHEFDESDFNAGIFISKFRNEGISRFIYISANPITTVKMVVQGVSGVILTDEFYFEDEEELSSIIEDTALVVTEETSIANVSVQIVKDFIYSFARGEARTQTPAYLEQVNQAVNELATLTKEQGYQITSMGKSAIEVFEKASNIIKSINDQRKVLEQQLVELETVQNNAPTKPVFGNNILMFPSFKYMNNAKVLVIRELSPCKYLTSFALAYTHHLHYEMNKRVKLIFVHQRGTGVALKYADYTSITQESMGLLSLYDNEIIATNNPKKDVMKELLNRQNDVYIVVDRLYGNQDIVTGKVERIFAVSGRSDLKRYKVKSEDCIFSIVSQQDSFFTIPTIKSYPTEVDSRFAGYSKICSSMYDKLDAKIGVVK